MGVNEAGFNSQGKIKKAFNRAYCCYGNVSFYVVKITQFVH